MGVGLDWIERIFHVSPDGGNGLTEALVGALGAALAPPDSPAEDPATQSRSQDREVSSVTPKVPGERLRT
jgi:hypothetical protein